MEKLNLLLSKVKCGTHININLHKDWYESVQQFFEDKQRSESFEYDEIEPEVMQEMIKRDNVVSLTCYPDTPVGSYTVYYYDVEGAVDLMLKILSK